MLDKEDGATGSSEGFLFDSDIMDIVAGIEGSNAVISGLTIAEDSPLAMTVEATVGVAIQNDTLRSFGAPTTVTIATADGIYNRNDIVCVDTSGAIVSSDADVLCKGTADANEEVPDTPSGYTRLGVIYVATGATTIVDAAISDARIINDTLAFLYGQTGLKGVGIIDNASLTTGIQDAIDALSTNGGLVIIPPGTYDEKITISDDEIIVMGCGWQTIIHETAESGHQITISGNNNIVKDLKTYTTQAGGNEYYGIQITGNDNVVDRVWVSSSDSIGINSATGIRTVVQNCTIKNTDGIGLSTGQQEVNFRNNFIKSTGSIGINLAGSDESIVFGNRIDTTADDGIYVSATADNCIVANNHITAWTNEAIDDDSGTTIAIGNHDGDTGHIRGPIMTAISQTAATTGVQDAIDFLGANGGLIIVPPGTYDEAITISNDAIILQGCGSKTIINQTTESANQITITGNQCQVRDLRVYTTLAGANEVSPIYISGADNILTDLMVTSSDLYGVHCAGARTVMTRLNVGASDSHGILITALNVRIENCYVHNSGAQGIYHDASGGESVITGNWIDTTADDGIYVSATAEDGLIVGNKVSGWTNEAIDDDSGTYTVANNETTV